MAIENSLPRVTDQNYPDYLSASAAVILFKIANCQKCEEFEPIVLDVSQQFNGEVLFGKALLHVPGACREIKRRYRFESFPTTHFYKGGQLTFQEDHKLTVEELVTVIRKYLL